MNQNTQMCLCGKPFVGWCRTLALSQLTGNGRVFDTSKLTNDPECNRQLIRNPENFIKDHVIHGLAP